MNDAHTLYEFEGAGYRVVDAKALYGRSATLQTGYVEEGVGYSEAAAEELYGAASVVVPAEGIYHYTQRMTTEPLYHGVAALTIIGYLFMLLRSWNFIGSIWVGAFTRPSERRMGAEGGVLPLQRFKQVAALLGVVVMSLVTVRLSEGVIPTHSALYTAGFAPYATLFSLLFIGVFVAWCYAIHKVVGWVTYSDVAMTLASIGYMNFVRFVTLLYPLVMVWLLATGDRAFYMGIVVIISVSLLLLLYLKDTFLFFVAKKISILYFILYLCTAILLPVSFLLHLLPTYLA